MVESQIACKKLITDIRGFEPKCSHERVHACSSAINLKFTQKCFEVKWVKIAGRAERIARIYPKEP